MRMSLRWTCAVLIVASVAGVVVKPGSALPLYTARTGLECRACHFDPNGGGPRNAIGFLYARQRHDLTPDPSPLSGDVAASNRVGDALSFGTNVRLLYVSSGLAGSGVTDVSTFFQMQGALHATFQPHPRLTLVMSRDFGEFSGDKTRDLFGMVHSASGRFYVKAGRLRHIYGLRQDDHTAGTRAGFLRTAAGGTSGLLPFDPRNVDSGLEAGASYGALGAAATLSNGGAAFANRAQAASAKITLASSLAQVGTSVYDNFESSSGRRMTRWGGYGLLRAPAFPDLAVLGEVGFGTDDDGAGSKRNLAATFLEMDYRVNRSLLLRAKYDLADVYRRVPGNASERFTVETDITLVPFADLKLSYRRIVPETSPDENQVLAMWHFYF